MNISRQLHYIYVRIQVKKISMIIFNINWSFYESRSLLYNIKIKDWLAHHFFSISTVSSSVSSNVTFVFNHVNCIISIDSWNNQISWRILIVFALKTFVSSLNFSFSSFSFISFTRDTICAMSAISWLIRKEFDEYWSDLRSIDFDDIHDQERLKNKKMSSTSQTWHSRFDWLWR